MSTPTQRGPDFPEHGWLVDQIAKLVGPRDLAEVSDADLEALLKTHTNAAYSPEEIERLLSRFWTEVSQPPAPPAILPVSDIDSADDSAHAPLPPSSSVFGFLGNLTSLGGFTPTLWSLLILISGMLLTLAVVVVTIRNTLVRVEVQEVAKTERGVPQPSTSIPTVHASAKATPPAVPGETPPGVQDLQLAHSRLPPSQLVDSDLATVTMAAGRWAQINGNVGNRAVAVGEVLQPGLLDLTQGIVEIAFRNGAAVLLESPTQVKLLGPERVFLISGRAVAHVPSSAVGFTIETSDARLVDQGTEFGVSVPPDGPVQVQVFEGEVIVEMKGRADGAAFDQRLTKGQAREIPAAPCAAAANRLPAAPLSAEVPRVVGPSWPCVTLQQEPAERDPRHAGAGESRD